MRRALLILSVLSVSAAAAAQLPPTDPKIPQPEPKIAAAASKMDRRTVPHTVTFANGDALRAKHLHFG